MQKSFQQFCFFLLLLLLAALLFIRLGAAPIYILDEAKNAQCAREMLLRHDFIVPTFNNALRTDKPPLHYFFMMMSYTVFGVNEFAARFFSAIMGLITVASVYFFTKKFLSTFSAFCASLVLVMSTHFLFEFRLAVPDPYLICFITIGIFSAFAWLNENKTVWLYIAAASLAMATLAKGPVAIALPGLCIFLWTFWKKKWKVFFTWHLIPALIMLCFIALPWYAAVDKATAGEWTRGFFIDNNFNRFSSPQEGHGGFFLLPLLFVLIGLFPFAIFSGEVIKKRKQVFTDDLVQFSLLVVAAFILFFSISSTKLPNYPMPCYPFAAVVLGKYISLLFEKEITSKNYPYFILLIVMAAIPVAGYFAVGKESETIILQKTTLWLLIPAAFFLIFLFIVKNNQKKFIAMCFAYTFFNVQGINFLYPELYGQNPVAKTLDLVKGSNPVFAYRIYNPGYNFYLKKNVIQFNDAKSLKNALMQYPQAVVISRNEMYDSLKMIPLNIVASHHDIFELPTTIILKYNAKP